VSWAELIRNSELLAMYNFEPANSHQQMIPTTKHVITVAVHTKKEVGTGLAKRILKDAGLE
jgi:predicted RNA binding protein YcfA (HicA-like mRNA interferase family)